MRGRKPVPTRLKIMRGNPGKRPLGKHESKPRAGIPKCPEHLDDEAKKAWKRLARQLHDSGLLTNVDRDALSFYCQAYSRWLAAESHLKKFGPVLVNKHRKFPIINPYLVIANQAMKQMQQFLTEFGMTPSSRAHLDVAPRHPQEDEFDAFLNEGNR